MDENGYYDSNDLWLELSDAEKKERLSLPGFELVNDVDGIWESLSNDMKRKVLSSHGSADGFIDLNKVNFDKLVDNLEKEIIFKSDYQSYVIDKLIEFYKKNK